MNVKHIKDGQHSETICGIDMNQEYCTCKVCVTYYQRPSITTPVLADCVDCVETFESLYDLNIIEYKTTKETIQKLDLLYKSKLSTIKRLGNEREDLTAEILGYQKKEKELYNEISRMRMQVKLVINENIKLHTMCEQLEKVNQSMIKNLRTINTLSQDGN